MQVILGGVIIFFYCVIFTCWIYRLIWPANRELRELRSAAWNDEHLSFWSSWREAEQVEREYKRRSNRHEGGSPE